MKKMETKIERREMAKGEGKKEKRGKRKGRRDG